MASTHNIFHSINEYGLEQFRDFFNSVPLPKRERERDVCKLLDITPGTLKRYLSDKGRPPRTLCRLLFMESHYGRAVTDAVTHQQFLWERALRKTLESRIEELKAAILVLECEIQELKASNDDQRNFAANSNRWAV